MPQHFWWLVPACMLGATLHCQWFCLCWHCCCLVQGIRKVPTRMRIQISRRRNDDEDAQVCSYPLALPHAGQAAELASCIRRLGGADSCSPVVLQEDMYSFVTYSEDQATKGKGTTIVEA